MADPNNTDLSVYQARMALKKLDEARLHERCPKACKACSQKHRKCQFKTGAYPKCDLCAKNNRECEIIPPVAHPNSRRTDDPSRAAGPSSSQTHQYAAEYAYPASPTSNTRERPNRTSQYSSDSSNGSPVTSSHPSTPYGYPQNDYQHNVNTPSGQVSHAYPSSQSQQSPYAGNLAHTHAYTPSPSGLSPTQTREQQPYYVPSQTHVQSPPNFVPSSHQWSGTHGVQTQAAPPSIGQGYAYPGGSHSTTPARQASAPNVPQIHTNPGQSYIRTAQGYQVASPASPGGSYGVPGNTMYQMQAQNTSARYGTGNSGQGYDQTMTNASSGTASGGMYYQPNMHQ
ncbi:uncharacterized protein FOMMEDRAFT_147640 [Fomitiporia mediterranea MF3/22]|uniref:uncharacterized protein n=1 Tax=Fomitiporia mediterranea (strain MF3/22) TaxID=694068 RepID=UPI00044094CB|nr:uncharacterized protein FOMMEDRAFT_147640 [Fomitiporia mediterranea MF3/22]EJD00957.1 hypothetical protein FOMMEDRAFT_147640 [Fomitiporia mediterranea MF3/22]